MSELLKKMVDGKVVDMTPEEDAATRAEWVANLEAASQATDAETGKQNVEATAERSRADTVADIERRINGGASAESVLADMLQLLKGQI